MEMPEIYEEMRKYKADMTTSYSGSPLTVHEVDVLAGLLKKTVTNIYKKAETSADAKRNARYADTHLFAFLSYLDVSAHDIEAISKRSIF